MGFISMYNSQEGVAFLGVQVKSFSLLKEVVGRGPMGGGESAGGDQSDMCCARIPPALRPPTAGTKIRFYLLRIRVWSGNVVRELSFECADRRGVSVRVFVSARPHMSAVALE